MAIIQKIALLFTIIGGITWGLIGIFDWNIVEAIFRNNTFVNIIYIFVGITALINIGIFFIDFKDEI